MKKIPTPRRYLYSFQLANNESASSQILGYSSSNTSVGGGYPAPGDYEGFGRSNIAIHNKAAQKFRVFAPPYLTVSENVIKEQTMNIDIPAPGDFNGDGRRFCGREKLSVVAVTDDLENQIQSPQWSESHL